MYKYFQKHQLAWEKNYKQHTQLTWLHEKDGSKKRHFRLVQFQPREASGELKDWFNKNCDPALSYLRLVQPGTIMQEEYFRLGVEPARGSQTHDFHAACFE